MSGIEIVSNVEFVQRMVNKLEVVLHVEIEKNKT